MENIRTRFVYSSINKNTQQEFTALLSVNTNTIKKKNERREGNI